MHAAWFACPTFDATTYRNIYLAPEHLADFAQPHKKDCMALHLHTSVALSFGTGAAVRDVASKHNRERGTVVVSETNLLAAGEPRLGRDLVRKAKVGQRDPS